MATNPFNLTKASDYSDEEINSYWVDIKLTGGFTNIVKPTSPMPMYILGGKGSGKTHIMRFYSYSLQKLKHSDKNIADQIKKDGYLGVYMRSSGLNSDKFHGKGVKNDVWDTVFRYYIELWLSHLLINCISDIAEGNENSISDELENEICIEILGLFDRNIGQRISTFDELKVFLVSLQKKVDYHVNNLSLSGGDLRDLEILTSSGRLIFGIPQILQRKVVFFEKVLFLYLIDEFENFTHVQQQYINTLLRERESPATFKIGARLYGVRTNLTFSAQEENKLGSEYEVYEIDKQFRDSHKEYTEFVRSICKKKIMNAGFKIDPEFEIDHFFEVFDLKKFQESLQSKKDSRRYFSVLERELNTVIKDKSGVKQIITNLSRDTNRLLERTNVFLFYREWKRHKKGLIDASHEICKSCDSYEEGSKDNMHEKVLDKYKGDIIDFLFRESGESATYLGLDNFIKMSSGIPRHLLIMLKHIYRWSNFNSETPFERGSIISQDSQRKGLRDAALWFLEDARVPGPNGTIVQSSFDRLGQLLQELRFSAIPPECSISSIRINREALTEEQQDIIKYLKQYSYLIYVGERRDKNSNRQDVTYQINGIIAPYYELSIHRRGVVSLSNDDIRSIIGNLDGDMFSNFLSDKIRPYNPPFQVYSDSLF